MNPRVVVRASIVAAVAAAVALFFAVGIRRTPPPDGPAAGVPLTAPAR
jgi:hypothetical protein